MLRTILSMILAAFTLIQGLHAECWAMCAEPNRSVRLADCHRSAGAERTLSDSHDCAEHAPQVALISPRTEPGANVIAPATWTPTALADAPSSFGGIATILTGDAASSPTTYRPLRI